MKMKKGKVYPSPPPPPSSSDESLSILNLLPATILVLVSVLSPEDREVLAYLITRGTTNEKKSSSKKHKPPVFDCECFDCYTSYWFRWDSSPNRELIHKIIEAFEDSCETWTSHNNSSNNKSKRGKKKEKPGRRVSTNKAVLVEVQPVAERNVASPESKADVAERGPKDVEGGSTAVVAAPTGHKGLARKVLPDVLGLFNSNFWRLWNPNA